MTRRTSTSASKSSPPCKPLPGFPQTGGATVVRRLPDSGSPEPPRIAYKISQAAKAIGISRYLVYQAIRRGDLLAYEPMPGGDWVITVEDLRAWLTRRSVQRGSEHRGAVTGETESQDEPE